MHGCAEIEDSMGGARHLTFALWLNVRSIPTTLFLIYSTPRVGGLFNLIGKIVGQVAEVSKLLDPRVGGLWKRGIGTQSVWIEVSKLLDPPGRGSISRTLGFFQSQYG